MTKIFLTHTSFDADIAMLLKAEFERRVPGLQVFLSSDPTDLPPGVRWSAEIQRALQDSVAQVVLSTKRSLRRPWVWFEVGTFWFTKRRVIPLCLGEVRKGTLPSPLSECQALNGDGPSDLMRLLDTVADITKTRVNKEDLADLVHKLEELERKADAIAGRALAGWLGVDWDNQFLAYAGPLEALKLIEDEIFQQAMTEALDVGGYKAHLPNPDRLSQHAEKGYRVVYLTDRRSWRRKIVRGDQILMAKPKDEG